MNAFVERGRRLGRAAIFLSLDGYAGLKERLPGALDADPAKPWPTEFFALPLVRDRRVPHWIFAIVVDGRGLRVAIATGGRAFTVEPGERDQVRFAGVDWIRVDQDPSRSLCYLSLAPLIPGRPAFVPDVDPSSPLAKARISAAAVDWILDFQPL